MSTKEREFKPSKRKTKKLNSSGRNANKTRDSDENQVLAKEKNDLLRQIDFLNSLILDTKLKKRNKSLCELHFSDDAIRRYTEAYNEKTGEKICVPLKRYRLQNFAVPTIFTDFPTYFFNSGNPTRDCPEKRLQRLENEHLQRSIQASIVSKEEFEKNKSFMSFPELVECLNAEELQDIWTVIFKKALVIIMMLDTIISPVIKASVIINKDLDLTIHIGQTKIDQLDFEDHNKFPLLEANFSTLKQLYDIESDNLVKFAYGLTLKALCPTNLEKRETCA
ncbi:THAP-type domain-containing protein [Trichonephila clavipes]|nr:THAP-type domain-containing protein [Trichonephila clavipes]